MYFLQLEPIHVMVLEAKTNKSKSDHSLCQTIGYFLASANMAYPPLAIVMTETKYQFLFYPYKSANIVYADSVVSPESDLDDHLGAVIAFVVKYVGNVIKKLEIQHVSQTSFTLNEKSKYNDSVTSVVVAIETQLDVKEKELEQALLKGRGLQQALFAKNAKESELQQALLAKNAKERELQQALLAKNAKERELQQALLAKNAKERELQQALLAKNAKERELYMRAEKAEAETAMLLLKLQESESESERKRKNP